MKYKTKWWSWYTNSVTSNHKCSSIFMTCNFKMSKKWLNPVSTKTVQINYIIYVRSFYISKHTPVGQSRSIDRTVCHTVADGTLRRPQCWPSCMRRLHRRSRCGYVRLFVRYSCFFDIVSCCVPRLLWLHEVFCPLFIGHFVKLLIKYFRIPKCSLAHHRHMVFKSSLTYAHECALRFFDLYVLLRAKCSCRNALFHCPAAQQQGSAQEVTYNGCTDLRCSHMCSRYSLNCYNLLNIPLATVLWSED